MTAADERDSAAGAWPADRIRRYVWLGAGVLIAAAVAYLAWRVATALAAVLIPVAIAVLLTALLPPVARRRTAADRLARVPRWHAHCQRAGHRRR